MSDTLPHYCLYVIYIMLRLVSLVSKGGVFDARETGEAFRDAEGRHVKPLEGGTVVASDWAAFGKSHVSIHYLLSQHGGIVPPARRGSPLMLTLAEREHLSRDRFRFVDS
jgi:hypothetical protein